MRKRTRRPSSLRPATSELERHQGVSTLLFGGAAAALSPIDQPSFIEVTGSPVGQANEERESGDRGQPAPLRPSTSLGDLPSLDAVIVPRGAGADARSSAPEPLARPATPVSADASDPVRPLTLAPSDWPQALTGLQAPPSQPSNQASSAVIVGADSSAAVLVPATPVINSPPAQTPNVTGGAPQALLGVVSSGVENPGQPIFDANGSQKAAGSHHVTAHGGARGTSGGIHLGTGRAATGGGSHRPMHHAASASGVRPDVSATSPISGTANSNSFASGATFSLKNSSGGGGSNKYASGTLSGSNKTGNASSGVPTGYTNTNAKWSIAGVGSGTAHIDHQEGANVIGGEVGYALNVGGGGTGGTSGGQGGAATIVPGSVSWSIQGAIEYNTGQSPPNPSQGQNTWNWNTYTTYSYWTQHTPSIIFCWGTTTGDIKLQASATVQVIKNGEPYTTTVTRNATAQVGAPGWQGTVVGLKSARYIPGLITYSRSGANGSKAPGVSWSFDSAVPGTMALGWGTIRVVQLNTSAITTVVVPSGAMEGTWTGYYQATNLGDGKVKWLKADPPGLDEPDADVTNPFYGDGPSSSDNPAQGAPGRSTDATFYYALSFTDYVMFQPPQGLYVPLGSFTWYFGADAAPNPGGPKPYKLTPLDTGLTAPVTSYNAWPGKWNYITGNFKELKKQP
jgi:hypothetical protein